MGIANSFDQYPREWHLWFTSDSPEVTSLPGIESLPVINKYCVYAPLYSLSLCSIASSFLSQSFSPSLFLSLLLLSFTHWFVVGEWENSCNELQRMLVVRSLRPDRVPQTVTTFVINNLGAKYVMVIGMVYFLLNF